MDLKAIGRDPKSKKVLIFGGIAAAAYVGYRWWSSRGTSSDSGAPTTDSVDAGVDASGVVGSGASGNVQYAGSTTSSDTTPVPGSFTNNAQWADYATTRLAATGRDESSVISALGDYLAKRPLSDSEQSIVRSAVAIAGVPPVGTFTIIPQVGAVTLTAPTGLKVTSTTKTTVSLSWNAVTGAGYYRAYRSGVSTNVGGSDKPHITIGGLSAGKTYKFAVAADTTTGKPGPKSSYISATTKK